jgi:uncharacterized protein YndB with AHSA1/START domain
MTIFPRVARPSIDVSILINAPAAAVVNAFFDHESLRGWWQAVRSVTTPRVLGPFAIDWTSLGERDEVLARFDGVFRGTVIHVEPERGFFVADAYWLPPDGDPIGPMALEVACAPEPGDDGYVGTRLRVTQSGFEESERWRRYYEVLDITWERALRALKSWLEKDHAVHHAVPGGVIGR